MDIFDLDNPIELGSGLQDSINILFNKFGEKFVIKNGSTEIPINLFKKQSKFSDGYFWSLKYSPPNRDQWLLPLAIDFIDRNLEKTDDAYLANITRINQISGTKMIETALKLLKTLGAKRVYLHDGARLDCGPEMLNLSFFKLIEKGTTFYQKFGFKFIIEDNPSLQFNFKDPEVLQEKLTEYVDKLKKIKTVYIINTYKSLLEPLFEVIKNQDYDNIKIELYHPTDPFIISYKDIRFKVLEMVSEIDSILNITKKSKHNYIYEEMINLFYIDCMQYSDLIKFIFDNQIYSVTYRSKKFVLKDIEIFDWIRRMKNATVVKEF